MADYKILRPRDPLYERALGQFWNYVLATPPNRREQTQPGNIFFIRAHGLEDGFPISRVGKNGGVTVRENQMVFAPVLVSIADSQNSNAPTIQERRNKVNLENGESEPPQDMTATIDGESILVPRPADYYVETEVDFTLNVPQGSPYSDPNMSDLDEVYSYSGDFPAIANGYAVILYDMKSRDRPYRLIIDARGRGNYTARAFYDISVVEDGQEEIRHLNLEKTFQETLQTRSINLDKAEMTEWTKYLQAADIERQTKFKEKVMKVAKTLGIALNKA